jgi:hypothetical protein
MNNLGTSTIVSQLVDHDHTGKALPVIVDVKERGIEVRTPTMDMTDSDCPIWIEFYDGKLRLHVYNTRMRNAGTKP